MYTHNFDKNLQTSICTERYVLKVRNECMRVITIYRYLHFTILHVCYVHIRLPNNFFFFIEIETFFKKN